MSIRFAIKNTAEKVEKEGDSIVRYTGPSEPFKRVSERTATKVGVDGAGQPKLVYTTGLSEKQVDFFKWYNEEERKEVKGQIKELKTLITDFYGGPEVVAEDNRFFWGENRDVNRLSLANEDIDVFYDTKNPAHALLYLGIISGAFIDLVSPTRDWADRHQIPHYLVLETDNSWEDEDDISRSDAHAALAELRKEGSPEALFILAWCIQYDTKSFGAVMRSTPLRSLVNYHIQFIDGKLQTKKKRNCPKIFTEYVERWNNQQTRPKLYAEAYVKAGEYFNYIQPRDKKYTTTEGTVLGNTVEEAVANILKPKFHSDFESLREKVENKWKE